MVAHILAPARVRRAVSPHANGWVQAQEERRHRYRICVIPDGPDSFQCLVVDHDGDSGAWIEIELVGFGEAVTTALHVNRDPAHQAFGAPIMMRPAVGGAA
ncbi:hypothetical protein GGQ86_001029 [Xanthobacter flavus]|uniref:Uncharacterized protein n=1 Tax=Xanthobacter flavus TaxID=281 RepID=A0A9W6CM36_XANFL|nr:hypothetical protein [Xanthobacter flavus]MDR6332582.1 hypothetical protein [Xanthobacter flavus]GLI21667.1 hypothetical protein XFLAVUS301_13410 [Xanthobacter flavus]